jgi:hypothetical protein
VTPDEWIAEVSRGGRICPQPQEWNRLWEMLPRQAGAGWEPSPPLILAAWSHSSDEQKRERFRDHLRWTHDHGAFGKIEQFITSLKPSDWHTER